MNQYGTDEGFIVSTAKFVKREVEEALDNLWDETVRSVATLTWEDLAMFLN